MGRYDKTICEIRKFNRFYTVNMGLLDAGYLDTEYSVVETRILFEMMMHEKCIQSDLAKALRIDKSYLSRLVKRFHKNGLIEKEKSCEDKRTAYLTLTEKGSTETERLVELTNKRIRAKIHSLSADDCDALCGAMNRIISILGKEDAYESNSI
ncbi:MAG: MarR family transcriptional regulator [Eubacterium sp.]|nr:MarR family transcriptional regulator [Eubacterium sp.]